MSPRDLLRFAAQRSRHDAGLLVVILLTVLATAAVLAGLPRWFDGLEATSLTSTLQQAPTTTRGVRIAENGRIVPGRSGDELAGVVQRGRTLVEELPRALGEQLDEPLPHVTTGAWNRLAIPGEPPTDPITVRFHVLPGADEHATLVEGRWPAAGAEPVPLDREVLGRTEAGVLEIAVSAVTARTVRWDLGEEVLLGIPQETLIRLRAGSTGRRPIVARVVGIYEPTPVAEDPFWWNDGRLHAPGVVVTISSTTFHTNVLVSPDTYPVLADLDEPFDLSYDWRADLRAAGIDPDDVPRLEAAAARGRTVPLPPLPGSRRRPSVATGLDRLLRGHLEAVAATRATLTVAAASLLTIALSLVALAAALLTTRRRHDTVLLRGRGASPGQLGAVSAIEAALLAIAGTAGGAAAATALIDGRTGSGGAGVLVALVFGVVVAMTTVALPTARRPLGRVADERAAASTLSRSRLIPEVATLLLAVIAAALLRTRGLGDPQDGVDPLLAVAPVLLLGAGAVVLIRLTELGWHARARWAHRGRGLHRILAARTGARRPGSTGPALLALLVGTATAVFAATIVDGVAAGRRDGASLDVGAAHRVEAPRDQRLAPAFLERLGTQGPVVTLSSVRVSTARDGRNLSGAELVLHRGELSRVLRAQPGGEGLPAAAATRAGAEVAVLASPAYLRINDVGVGTVVEVELDDRRFAARIVASRASLAGRPADEPWLAARRSEVEEATGLAFPATAVLIGDEGPDAAAIDALSAETLSSTTTVLHAHRLREERAAQPLARGLHRGFLTAAALASLLALVGLVIGLIVHAREDRRDLAVLRTLGASGVELRALLGHRLVTIVATGTVGGAALGLATSWLLVPALDLAALADGPTAPATLGLAVAGIVGATAVLAGGVAATQRATAWRTDPASELRRSEP